MNRFSTRLYDLFKLIVTIVLVIILLLLLLQGAAGAPKVEPTAGPLPTLTTRPTRTPTGTPPPIPPPTATLPPTPTLAPTATPPPLVDAPPAPTQVSPANCVGAVTTRLMAGGKAYVLKNLNLRAGPSIYNDLLGVNPAGTLVEIIDGPFCEPAPGGAYLWWQVRQMEGAEGWSSEGTVDGRTYFLEPLP